MLDLSYFRGHLDEIERMAKNRHTVIDVARFQEIDGERRQIITSTERMKAERNKASEEIARLKKAGGDAGEILARMKQVSDDIKLADERVAALDESLREYMLTVPNVPHSSVPVGAGAADNV